MSKCGRKSEARREQVVIEIITAVLTAPHSCREHNTANLKWALAGKANKAQTVKCCSAGLFEVVVGKVNLQTDVKEPVQRR